MKNKLLSPYFAIFFVICAIAVYYILCFLFSIKFGYFDIEEIGVTETLTYIFYGFSFGVIFCYFKDFINSPDKNTFFALIFLQTVCLFREMGIQHWLTSHDTVITKTRFFLNPNNPLYEKLIAGFLMLSVVVVFVWVLSKNFKKLALGFIKFQNIPWTIAIFSILTVITQIADRFPANYLKATGMNLSEHITFVLKILEEGGESLLPLLFVIGILQWHLTFKREK